MKRIENASESTMRFIKTVGKIALWMWVTTFAFTMLAYIISHIR